MKSKPWIFLPLALLASACLADELDVLHLPIGDPETRDREVPVALDAITEARTGELLTPAELPARLAGVDLLLVGESHTNIEFHRVQQRVIEELERAGRRVMIGLEMFPYTRQEHLDRWVGGHYTEDGFLELADWYESWGYHWGYYRDIFTLARERGIPMFAVNAPRKVISAVREKGFEELSEEEAAHIPRDIDVDSDEHLRLFKAYFEEDDPIHVHMTDEGWRDMLRAQCTWDATMAHNALRALEERGGDGTILVVLVGSGHVAYGLGVERQAARWFDGAVSSLVPVPVRDHDGEPVETVQGSYADFVWGLPEEDAPIYPVLGASTREDDREEGLRKIIHISEGSPAERSDLEVGDAVLSVDGVEIRSKGTLNRLLAGKRWGDALAFTVRRGEETMEIGVMLRRSDEEEEEEAAAGEEGEDEEAEDDRDEDDGGEEAEPSEPRDRGPRENHSTG